MSPRQRFTLAAGILATALPVAALLGGALCQAAGWTGAGEAIRGLFAEVCHQRPERSFVLGGYPLGVCARCTGVYLGLLAGASLFVPLRRWLDAAEPFRLKIAGFLFLPAIVQPALSIAGVLPDTALLRAAGAFPAALAAGLLVAIALVELAGPAGLPMEGVPRAKA